MFLNFKEGLWCHWEHSRYDRLKKVKGERRKDGGLRVEGKERRNRNNGILEEKECYKLWVASYRFSD